MMILRAFKWGIAASRFRTLSMLAVRCIDAVLHGAYQEPAVLSLYLVICCCADYVKWPASTALAIFPLPVSKAQKGTGCRLCSCGCGTEKESEIPLAGRLNLSTKECCCRFAQPLTVLVM